MALGGALLCALYGISSGPARSTVLVLAAAAPAAVVLSHLARRRFARPAPWWFLAAGLTSLAVNSVMWLVQVGLGGMAVAQGAVADATLLAGYVLLLIGAVLVLTPFARQDGGALAEAGVGWLASASLLWVVLMQPALVRQGASPADHLHALLVVLLVSGIAGMLLRVAAAHRAARPSLLYLLLAVALTLVGTVARTLTYEAADGSSAHWLGAVWIVAYGAVAAACVHPSSDALTASSAAPADRLSITRLTFFGLALGLNPVLAGLQQALRSDVDWMLLTLSTLAIVPLVVIRIGRLARRQEQAEQALARLASRDELTGLANRRVAIAHLTDVLQRLEAGDVPGVTALFLDVDGLKAVNDQHGHGAGDAVICAVARRVDQASGPGTLTARLGGDEMLVVAVGAAERRDALIGDVRRALDGRVELGDGVSIAATAALGACWVGAGEHTDAARVIAEADRAMYQDKRRQAEAAQR